MARIDDERPVEDVVTPAGARAGQVASASAGVPTGQAGVPGARRTRTRGGIRGREGTAGWIFVAPMIIILGLFLVLPIAHGAVGQRSATGTGAATRSRSAGADFVGAEELRRPA